MAEQPEIPEDLSEILRDLIEAIAYRGKTDWVSGSGEGSAKVPDQ